MVFICIFVRMKTEHRISVVINTYNAETHLAEVIEAASGFDEIVVCDMESTNGTVEVAASLRSKSAITPSWNRPDSLPSTVPHTRGCWSWMPMNW